MNKNERYIVSGILAVVAVMVGVDLLTDSKEGVQLWHVYIEGFAGVASLFGIFYFLKGVILCLIH